MGSIRLAMADDSTFIRHSIKKLLAEVPGIECVGFASSGESLVSSWRSWRPDVVILDLDMPGMSGLETVDWIMRHGPVPVIILSIHSKRGSARTIEALEHGAIDFIDKGECSMVDFEALRSRLLEKIEAYASSDAPSTGNPTAALARPKAVRSRESGLDSEAGRRRIEIAVVAASTGGPPVVRAILRELRPGPPVPVVIVQHLPDQFKPAFAESLADKTRCRVKLAKAGTVLEPGAVYVAAGPNQLEVQRAAGGSRLRMAALADALHSPHCPSADPIFRSVAAVSGRNSVGVVLTGMGDDGALGMQAIARAGGCTIVQDEPSSLVWGMPAVAKALAADSEERPPSEIGTRLRELLEQSTRSPRPAD